MYDLSKNNDGFTLIECILVLSLFSLIFTSIVNVYLTSYKMYSKQDFRVETEENILAVLNRIIETLRRTDNLHQNISVSNQVLTIGNTKYYIKSNTIYEQIGLGVNQLAHNISLFDPKLDNGYLTLSIEAPDPSGNELISIEQTIFLGGE